MDTQGLFDTNTGMKTNMHIAVLSFLLSSVNIYNITKLIEEPDLQYLRYFAAYGEIAAENKKQFQVSHSLLIK